MLGLTIMFVLTVSASLHTGFNLVMWNEWRARWTKVASVAINGILLVAAAMFWIALADGISREAYICKTYTQRV